MAAMRSRAHAAIGSAKWIYDEREQAGQFIEQEVEEFAFSARNEFEWLNEHMAEIFSANQFEVTEVFKTPGKLRGKTPRTGRKHTPAQGRQPLTDIFSSNTPNNSGTPKNNFYQKLAPIQVAEDKENGPDETSPKRLQKSPLRPQPNPQCRQASPKKVPTPPLPPRSPLRPSSAKKSPSPSRLAQLKQGHDSRSTGDSFFSAKETQPHVAQDSSDAQASFEEAEHGAATANKAYVEQIPESSRHAQDRESSKYSVSTATAAGLEDAMQEVERQSPHRAEPAMRDVTASPSDTSSPGRSILRKKSSLNFASLPAREPLAKKSVGARISHARAPENRPSARDSAWNRQSQAPSAPIETHDQVDDDATDVSVPKLAPAAPTTADSSKLQSKTSTQRLHERITMLGKTNPPVSSKSMSTMAVPGASEPGHANQQITRGTNAENDDDDWIAPIDQSRAAQQSLYSTQPSTQQSMPGSFSTSAGGLNTQQTQDTTMIDSQPTQPDSPKPDQTTHGQASYPDLQGPTASTTPMPPPSTTPAGSPMMQRWNVDGPLSASKARFNAFLKSAKGMFASSAATSAQAKMENLKSPASKSTVHLPATAEALEDKRPATANPVTRLHSHDDEFSEDAEEIAPRRRSSQRLLEKQQSQNRAQMHEQAEVEVIPEAEDNEDLDMTEDTIAAPSKPPQSVKTQSKSKGLATQSGELRHPNKANKGNKVTKPAPGASKSAMSVRVPSQKTMGAFASSLHSSSSENRPGPTTAKPPPLTKKGSNSSLKSGTSTVNKTTASNNARVKALDAAAKSKEREEQQKQRKADEKRERERKRAEAEESRQKRQQEQKAAEQRREREEQEARAAAQRQRREREEQERLKAEKQSAEMQRKNEALRRQAEVAKAAKARQVEAVEQDAPRPVSRSGEAHGGTVRPHVNPAKPKRYFQPEDDERPASRPPTTTTQTSGYASNMNGSKRRKTGEEEPLAQPQPSTRPTMAPPVRPSMARKQEAVPNRFAHGFMASSAAGSIKPGPSSYTLNQQPKTPHNMTDVAKFSSAKIPFADNPNPPAPSSTQQGPSRQKTPGTAHKSSPVPNGDNISLPEIATDSEDESDDDFVAPDWTQSPELRALLERQQLVDPLKVFGPIGELRMEEVFKGNKDRLARFRARTSSANWSGPDRLTDEERRKDREARERLEKDGGWSFRPDL